VKSESPGFKSPLTDTDASKRSDRDSMDMGRNDAMLMPGQIEEESKNLDPSSIYNPQFIEQKKIDNLKAILDINT
jgi:hypothetical protein